jgi:hypothetical protein
VRAIYTLRQPRSLAWRAAGVAVLALMVSTIGAQQPTATDARFPDVLSATVRSSAADRFDFDVTISSPYDTPQRYADGFRVMRVSGEVLGERTLWHDHQAEQPFTRDLYGVKILSNVRLVRIQARDQKHGYGGKSIEVPLPGRS